MASSDPCLVTFRGGFVADVAIVSRLIDIEARGATFELLPEGRFKVVPPERLTGDDVAFLRTRRDEARAAIEYSHRLAAEVPA